MSNQSKRAKNAIKKAKKSRLAQKHKKYLTLQPTRNVQDKVKDNDESLSELHEELHDMMQQAAELQDVPKVDVDYESLISDFSGTMEEWDKLVLKTHIDFGLSFDYEDLAEELFKRIKSEFPRTEEQLKDNNLSIAEFIAELRKSHTSKYLEMYVINDEQDDAFWRGELDEYLPY